MLLYFTSIRKGKGCLPSLLWWNTCSQSSCFYPHYSHFEFPGCAGVFLQLSLNMQNICWDEYWHICKLHSDMRGNIQIGFLRWDVKMKEKELESFVSFAVQFRKVCAVYIYFIMLGNHWHSEFFVSLWGPIDTHNYKINVISCQQQILFSA